MLTLKGTAAVGGAVKGGEQKRETRKIAAFTRVDYVFMKLHSDAGPPDPISFYQRWLQQREIVSKS